MVSLEFSHTLFDRRTIAADAFPILEFRSVSRLRLLEMVEPRYVKSSTTSRVQSPMEMQGAKLTSWPRMLVFFILIVRENSLQARENQLMSSWRAASVCAVRVASSANSNSRMRTFGTLFLHGAVRG